MLERLAGNEYYCFLDGFSSYFQIPIDPKDQEKTTFTCPYGTFAYRRMPFGLCNAPGTFQRCMMAIFHDMIKKTMDVFMDDFSIFGNSFETCHSHLEKMIKRCEDINLCLNWEKSHFMVKEGIILGHKISKNGIEVDKAKVDVTPTTVKGKLKTYWSGPFTITQVFPYGNVELSQTDRQTSRDWVKLSDPKQALRGRHPEFPDFEDLCSGFCPSITGSSLSRLHLGIKYPNLID
nr:reverse transcriptase domain-containing protein [Tanacetum cinerariifolium]